jgi:hypothetical protein
MYIPEPPILCTFYQHSLSIYNAHSSNSYTKEADRSRRAFLLQGGEESPLTGCLEPHNESLVMKVESMIYRYMCILIYVCVPRVLLPPRVTSSYVHVQGLGAQRRTCSQEEKVTM